MKENREQGRDTAASIAALHGIVFGYMLVDAIAVNVYPHMRPRFSQGEREEKGEDVLQREVFPCNPAELATLPFQLATIRRDISNSGQSSHFLHTLDEEGIGKQVKSWAKKLGGKDTRAAVDASAILGHLLRDPLGVPGVTPLVDSTIVVDGEERRLYHFDPKDAGQVMRRGYAPSRKWRPVFAVIPAVEEPERRGESMRKGVVAMVEFDTHNRFDRLRFMRKRKR